MAITSTQRKLATNLILSIKKSGFSMNTVLNEDNECVHFLMSAADYRRLFFSKSPIHHFIIRFSSITSMGDIAFNIPVKELCVCRELNSYCNNFLIPPKPINNNGLYTLSDTEFNQKAWEARQLTKLKNFLSGPEFERAGKADFGFFCLRFRPRHIEKMCEAASFSEMKEIAREALSTQSPNREDQVRLIYGIISIAEAAENVCTMYYMLRDAIDSAARFKVLFSPIHG